MPRRIASIDILRGLIMIVMALDHTRDYFHITGVTADPLDPATTTVGLYFTRWITHFCAPGFVFLSGLSAFLSAQKKTRQEAAVFLIKRGAWLVVAELTIVNLGLTFNPFFTFVILQVIWAIGWSMIILGLLSRYPFTLTLVIGLLLFFGHNAADYITFPQQGRMVDLWRILLTASGTIIVLDEHHLVGAFYAILPWTGIMLLGYCTGYLYRHSFVAVKRKQLLLMAGSSLIVLFVVLRLINHYGDPVPWQPQASALRQVFAFLNASKYPPSLDYACMTLGPLLIALALLEEVQSPWTRFVTVYGNVPFFYYILHFYLLHALLVIFFYLTGYNNSQIIDNNPFFFRQAHFGYTLPVVYAIWAAVVLALYYPCRWFGQYKRTHTQWWLRYI
ncbi:DUF1624 domain-containing protein [Chitinophaga solisilvae]|uniref:DUF1624 domain-containing protein n=1 Tax=Chitinophaga solisilvae TaxID=1233460 RepID=UPI00136C9881|nr:heparan-alpha-glucosaminide N-acetyltransferase domain-containing protein [Chitinophaga solisilvae]